MSENTDFGISLWFKSTLPFTRCDLQHVISSFGPLVFPLVVVAVIAGAVTAVGRAGWIVCRNSIYFCNFSKV